MQPVPEDLLPLTPAVLHILLSLAEGEKHGYAIMQEVAHLSQGKVKMGPGTLYGTLKRMLRDGLVAEAGDRADPESPAERRRYYRLTALGRQLLSAELDRLASLVDFARLNSLLPVDQHPGTGSP